MIRKLPILILLLAFAFTGRAEADITTGLVGCWPCQDNAASTTVAAVVGTNGALNGAGNTSASTVAGPGGRLARALLLDGTNDYISAATTGGTTGACSYGAWEKFTNTTADGYVLTFGINDTDYRAQLGGFQDGKVNAFTNAHLYPIGAVAANSQMAVSATTWTHVFYTFDGTTVKGYINGAQVITGTGDLSSGSGTSVTIGTYLSHGGNFSPVAVADVRIYTRGLTASDVAELSNNYLVIVSRGRSVSSGVVGGTGKRGVNQ